MIGALGAPQLQTTRAHGEASRPASAQLWKEEQLALVILALTDPRTAMTLPQQ